MKDKADHIEVGRVPMVWISARSGPPYGYSGTLQSQRALIDLPEFLAASSIKLLAGPGYFSREQTIGWTARSDGSASGPIKGAWHYFEGGFAPGDAARVSTWIAERCGDVEQDRAAPFTPWPGER